jgi:hypothetical protein
VRSGSLSSRGSTKQGKGGKARKALAKVGKQKAKRVAKNREYYASAEWRAKRKAVFERDFYQCTETITVQKALSFAGEVLNMGRPYSVRCPNRGEVVNGKQTGRGLVCEETSYGHRGVEGAIDRIKTRCKGCDRRRTPLERINHAAGFNSGARRGERV